MEDSEIRAALNTHWAASDANDFELEHQIYREDAVLEYPQSAERIRGRRNIRASRFAQPSLKRFTVRRILGGWLFQASWVPQHLMAGGCVVLAIFLIGRLGFASKEGGPVSYTPAQIGTSCSSAQANS